MQLHDKSSTTHIELDFAPTKRLQNFGGGSGTNGGGRCALASKSMSLQGEVWGGSGTKCFATLTPVQKTAVSSRSHNVSGLDVCMDDARIVQMQHGIEQRLHDGFDLVKIIRGASGNILTASRKY